MSHLNGAQRPACFALLVVAMLGLSPVLQSCSAPPQVLDPATGQLRPMTPEEQVEIIKSTGRNVEQLLVAAGRPDWAAYADLVTRVLALIAAWFVRPKQSTPGGVAPPSAPSGAAQPPTP